jgi:hypothetical protein
MNREQKRILFVGLGNLGMQVFDEFACVPGNHHFLVGGRNLEYVQQRTTLSFLSALQRGRYPRISCTHLDLDNVEQTAETIAHFAPDIIFCAVTTQPWLRITALPKHLFERLYQAQVGPWLPLTLTPVYKLMQAVRHTGLSIKVINASYPDVINAVLAQVFLSPTTGIGNIANNIPALRASVALKLGRPLEQVEVRFFAAYSLNHRISRQGNAGGIPFHLTVLVNGEDQTQLLDLETVFDLLPTRFNRSVKGGNQLITAASATVVFQSMVNNIETITHVPGPNGLPGGYPVSVNENGVEVLLPSGLSLEAAIHINKEGLRFDGIEHIEKDGTVFFTERNMAPLKELLGYECRRMPLDEVEQWAQELRAKYLALEEKSSK